MRRKSSAIDTALSIEGRKFMAWSGLLKWARAVVVQAERIVEARRVQTLALQHPDMHDGPAVRLSATLALQTEQHFFCIAANKFVEFRDFIAPLGLLDQRLFAEIDKYKVDIKAVRDFNEHDVEYFIGKGAKPAAWDLHAKRYNSDPTGTLETRIGGRLDWVKLQDAMTRLLNSLPEFWSLILPHMPTR
jgi:hypothetical protein